MAQLRCLVALHEYGTLTRAAKVLKLSQPALTRSLQDLQSALGLTLLTRAGRRLVLTESGQALLRHARTATDRHEEAEADLRCWLQSRRLTVTLASSAMPLATNTPRAVAMVFDTHPEARIRVLEAVYPDVMRLFRDGTIDLAIGPVPNRSLGDAYRVELLGQMPMCIALSTKHRLRNARSLTELKDARWISAGSAAVADELATQAMAPVGLPPPTPIMQVGSVTSALHFVEHSDFVTIVPRPLAQQWARAGRVAIAPIAGPMPYRLIGIYQPAHINQSPVVQSLHAALRLTARTLFAEISISPN